MANGIQNPKHATLKAIAKFLRTDVDKMLYMTPEEAGDVMEFEKLPPTERKRALRSYRLARGDGE